MYPYRVCRGCNTAFYINFDKEVNVNSPVKLRCVAYGSGGLSTPSIEWTSVTNGRTSTIGNSTSTRVIMIVQMAD